MSYIGKKISFLSVIAMLFWVMPFLTITVPLIVEARHLTFGIGDYIQFGSYYDEPILWKVINLDEDGNPLLLSDKILALKAFDTPGGYHTDSDRRNNGSNEWEFSNIRQWLNSYENTIEWWQNSPSADNTKYGYNLYDTEKGFLADSNFTSNERSIIKPITHKSLLAVFDMAKRDKGKNVHKENDSIASVVQNYDTAYYKYVTDHVFLLSIKELHDYVYARGWEYRAKPTEAAVDNSIYKWTEKINNQSFWRVWLRSPSSIYHTYLAP